MYGFALVLARLIYVQSSVGLNIDCSKWVKAGLITHDDMLDRNWAHWTSYSLVKMLFSFFTIQLNRHCRMFAGPFMLVGTVQSLTPLRETSLSPLSTRTWTRYHGIILALASPNNQPTCLRHSRLHANYLESPDASWTSCM